MLFERTTNPVSDWEDYNIALEELREVVCMCEECRDAIYSDEVYYDIDGERIHEDCLKDWADKYRRNYE